MAAFVWTARNRASATKHGVSIAEIERVVNRPLVDETLPKGLLRVFGRTSAGEYIEVVYRMADEDAPVDWAEVDMLAAGYEDDAVLVFHARFLTDTEKRRLRRRLK